VSAIGLRGHRRPADERANYQANPRAGPPTHRDEHRDRTNERHIQDYAQEQRGEDNRWVLPGAMHDSQYKGGDGDGNPATVMQHGEEEE
jgi:hypothetical protein